MTHCTAPNFPRVIAACDPSLRRTGLVLLQHRDRRWHHIASTVVITRTGDPDDEAIDFIGRELRKWLEGIPMRPHLFACERQGGVRAGRGKLQRSSARSALSSEVARLARFVAVVDHGLPFVWVPPAGRSRCVGLQSAEDKKANVRAVWTTVHGMPPRSTWNVDEHLADAALIGITGAGREAA